MAVRELFFVEFHVHDRELMVRWYVEILELKRLLDDPAGDFTLLAAGATRLAIKGGRDDRGSSSVALIFRVDDLAEERRRLIGLGVDVSGVEDSAEGYRAIRLIDPAGRPIQLFEWTSASNPEDDFEKSARSLP